MLMKDFVEGLNPKNSDEYVVMMTNVLVELRDKLWAEFETEQDEEVREKLWYKHNSVEKAIGNVKSNTFKDFVNTVLYFEL